MAHLKREVRGIPLWLLREYLVEGGGRATGEDRVDGEGWTARLVQLDDYKIGNLSVGQVRIELEGTPEGLRAVDAFLAPKLLRGGG